MFATIKNISASSSIFGAFSRENLRKIADAHGIKKGQRKDDTIIHLMNGDPVQPGVKQVHFDIGIEIPIKKKKPVNPRKPAAKTKAPKAKKSRRT